MTSEQKKEIADTILAQLRCGAMRLQKFWSWGANAFRFGEDNKIGYNAPFLHFRVTGLKFRGVVRVYHNSLDYYTVLFLNLKGVEMLPRLEDVDCEGLNEAIDDVIEKVPEYTNF